MSRKLLDVRNNPTSLDVIERATEEKYKPKKIIQQVKEGLKDEILILKKQEEAYAFGDRAKPPDPYKHRAKLEELKQYSSLLENREGDEDEGLKVYIDALSYPSFSV